MHRDQIWRKIAILWRTHFSNLLSVHKALKQMIILRGENHLWNEQLEPYPLVLYFAVKYIFVLIFLGNLSPRNYNTP